MNNNLEDLKILKELLDMGAITEEEYAKKKAQILGFQDDSASANDDVVNDNKSDSSDFMPQLRNFNYYETYEHHDEPSREIKVTYDKKKQKKQFKIAGIIMALLIIFAVACQDNTKEKPSKPEFSFSDTDITIEAGKTKNAGVHFENFEDDSDNGENKKIDLSNCVFTSDDDNIASVAPDGTITAKTVGKTYINAYYVGEGTDEEKNERLAKLTDKLKKGKAGDDIPRLADYIEVKVTPAPQPISNGQIVVQPKTWAYIPFRLKAPEENNIYVFLKGDNPNNNISFYVAKGQIAQINVPADKYKIYYALGKTWYGTELYFGKSTEYYKDDGKTKFYSDAEGAHGYSMVIRYDSYGMGDNMTNTSKSAFEKATQ